MGRPQPRPTTRGRQRAAVISANRLHLWLTCLRAIYISFNLSVLSFFSLYLSLSQAFSLCQTKLFGACLLGFQHFVFLFSSFRLGPVPVLCLCWVCSSLGCIMLASQSSIPTSVWSSPVCVTLTLPLDVFFPQFASQVLFPNPSPTSVITVILN